MPDFSLAKRLDPDGYLAGLRGLNQHVGRQPRHFGGGISAPPAGRAHLIFCGFGFHTRTITRYRPFDTCGPISPRFGCSGGYETTLTTFQKSSNIGIDPLNPKRNAPKRGDMGRDSLIFCEKLAMTGPLRPPTYATYGRDPSSVSHSVK